MGKERKRNNDYIGTILRHVAIIMDGNGRWAEKRGLPPLEGHRRGRSGKDSGRRNGKSGHFFSYSLCFLYRKLEKASKRNSGLDETICDMDKIWQGVGG